MTVHPEARKAADAAEVSSTPTRLFIGGRWVDAESGGRMLVVNPATEQLLAEVADASPADGLRAVAAVHDAQSQWATTPPAVRSAILYRAHAIMTASATDLARLITLEMGKPLVESRTEVAYAAGFFRWFAEEAVRIDGGYARRPDGGARSVVMKQPVGPCLLVVPWNFPLAMGARKLGPALAAGCACILKPAPQTPLTSLRLVAILEEAGVPPGVVNVLTTSRAEQIVPPILDSGVVRKLSFTGSTDVGKILLAQAARRVISTSMELGGNAAFLVLPDADLEVAVDAALTAKMRNMGEACTAANRFFVHSDVVDEFVRRLATRMGALTVGDGIRPEVDVGPLIDAAARQKVLDLVTDAVERGAAVVTGGRAPHGHGYFVEPTVLSGVDPASSLVNTEIFGPVAAVQTFTDLNEAITAANATPWGLVAYVMTSDIDHALNVAEQLEVGMVGLNSGMVSTPSAPFGGVKESGLGREGGRLGIEEYLETKYVSIPVRA